MSKPIRVSAGKLSLEDLRNGQGIRLVDADRHFVETTKVMSQYGREYDRGHTITKPAVDSLREYVEASGHGRDNLIAERLVECKLQELRTKDADALFKELLVLDQVGPKTAVLFCIALKDELPNIEEIFANEIHEELFVSYNEVPIGREDERSTMLLIDNAKRTARSMAESAVRGCEFKNKPTAGRIVELAFRNTTEFKGRVGDTTLMQAECDLYSSALTREVKPSPELPDEKKDAFEDIANFLDDNQYEQLKKFLASTHRAEFLDGIPGCGKTHLTTALYNYYMKCGCRPLIMSYSNRACLNLQERLPDYEFPELGLKRVPTIMSAYYRASARAKDNPLSHTQLIIVDEASTVSSHALSMIKYIADHCHSECKILYVGDRNQLEPVKAYGRPFVAILEELDRKGREYLTLLNYKRSNSAMYEGFCKLRNAGDHEIHESDCISLATVADIDIAKNIVARMYKDGSNYKSFCCIAETRAQVCAVNIATVKKIYGLNEAEFVIPNKRKPSEPRVELPLEVGLRIMAIDNIQESKKCSAEIAKSEFATITSIGVIKSTITLDRGNHEVKLNTSFLKDYFAVGYAATVHSYQGSEADEVIYILENSANMRGNPFYSQKELKYVGLSRARKKLDILALEKGTTGISKVKSIKVHVTSRPSAHLCFTR